MRTSQGKMLLGVCLAYTVARFSKGGGQCESPTGLKLLWGGLSLCVDLKGVVELSLGPMLRNNQGEVAVGVRRIVPKLHECTLAVGEDALLQDRVWTANPGAALVDADRDEVRVVIRLALGRASAFPCRPLR